MQLLSVARTFIFNLLLSMSGCITRLENYRSKYSKNSEGDYACTYGHTYFITCIIFLRTPAGLVYYIYCFNVVESSTSTLLYMDIFQVAGRSLGELVRKLGERVLPSIIPILSQGLKDPDASRRQVCIFSLMRLQKFTMISLFLRSSGE